MSEQQEFDGRGLVERHFPLGGRYSEVLLSQAAAAQAALARYMAHATLGAACEQSLPYANSGSGLMGNLTQAAASQQQALRQIATWYSELAEDPDLRHDDLADPKEPAERGYRCRCCSRRVPGAADALGDTAYQLGQAHRHIGHLYQDDEQQAEIEQADGPQAAHEWRCQQ